MLARAGVAFDVQPANIDERAVQDGLMGEDGDVEPADIAELLAEAKAIEVSARKPDALVIGSDQVLNIGAQLLMKPVDLAAARSTLQRLRGKTHQLHSGVALARDGEVLWSQVDSADLTMRKFSDTFLDSYIEAEGKSLCSCVGAFKLEGRGLQLFERVEGDFFTILGMPLLPLLSQLRVLGAIPA